MAAHIHDEQFWPRICLGLMLAALIIGVNFGYMAALQDGHSYVSSRFSAPLCTAGMND